MADVTVKRLDEFDTTFGGAMKLVRHGLGVESFGLQVIDIPPNVNQYPEHDHAADAQEEVYTVLEGFAILIADGEEHELRPGTFARVGPAQKRKIETRGEPVRLIAIGATAGRAYEIAPFTVPGAA
jgi:uncharacterized cupin superfamily protein